MTNQSVYLSEPEGQAWECTEAEPLLNPETRYEVEVDEEEEDDEEEEEEEWKQGVRKECSSPCKSTKEDDATEHPNTSVQSGDREMAQQSKQSPSSETPVCAKNISLTPSGEKVVLWTRSAPT